MKKDRWWSDDIIIALVISLVVLLVSCENAKDPVSTMGQSKSLSPPPCQPGPGVVCATPTPYPVPNCPDCPCTLAGPGIYGVPACTPTPTATPTMTPTIFIGPGV